MKIKIIQEVRTVDSISAVRILQESCDLFLLDNSLHRNIWKWHLKECKWWKGVFNLLLSVEFIGGSYKENILGSLFRGLEYEYIAIDSFIFLQLPYSQG